jgi:hypothetical protein
MRLRFGGNPYGLVCGATGMVRAIKYGRLAAQYERQKGEVIVPLTIKKKDRHKSHRAGGSIAKSPTLGEA